MLVKNAVPLHIAVFYLIRSEAEYATVCSNLQATMKFNLLWAAGIIHMNLNSTNTTCVDGSQRQAAVSCCTCVEA